MEITLAQYRPITTAYETILHILYTVDKAYEAKMSYIINQTVTIGLVHIYVYAQDQFVVIHVWEFHIYIHVTRHT